MKAKECLRLANLSLMNNRKQTKNTIISFSFGLTFLIIVLFIVFSINFGILKQTNKLKAVSSIKITYGNTEQGFLDKSTHDEISINNSITEDIMYHLLSQRYLIESGAGFNLEPTIYYPIIKIDETEYTYDYNPNTNVRKHDDKFSYYDIKNNTSIFTNAEIEFLKLYNGNYPILSGKTLSGVENEILISSVVLDYFNLNYDSVIGKTLSYSLIQKSEEEKNINTILENMTIVGVFDKSIYASPSRGEEVSEGSIFWLNECDYSSENGTLCENIQFNDFTSAFKFYRSLSDAQGVDSSSLMYDYEEYYPLISLVIYVFSFFGIVIFVAAIINLFNTARYNSLKNKRYIAMCKALGMIDSDIIRIHCYENLIISLKSLIPSISISFIISLFVSILSKHYLSSTNLPLDISISLLYYPLTAILVIFTLMILSLLIGCLTCVSVIGKKSLIINNIGIKQ